MTDFILSTANVFGTPPITSKLSVKNESSISCDFDIVKDYLSNNLSYIEAAEKHNISYNNIYSWVQKYKEYGPDGLVDNRGRRKPSTIQTDEEKLKTEIATLKARNEYLVTENAALKKLKKVERELMLRKRGMKQNSRR